MEKSTSNAYPINQSINHRITWECADFEAYPRTQSINQPSNNMGVRRLWSKHGVRRLWNVSAYFVHKIHCKNSNTFRWIDWLRRERHKSTKALEQNPSPIVNLHLRALNREEANKQKTFNNKTKRRIKVWKLLKKNIVEFFKRADGRNTCRK